LKSGSLQDLSLGKHVLSVAKWLLGVYYLSNQMLMSKYNIPKN